MFRLADYPADARAFFKDAPILWPAAVSAAIEGEVTDLEDLTDLVFYMHHKERMRGQTGRPLDPGEPQFDQLAAEWQGFQTMLRPMVKAAVSDTSTTRGSSWKLTPAERRGCREAGGEDFLDWALTEPEELVETAEFEPAADLQDRFTTLFAWKSATPSRTCLPDPKRRLQFVLMLRDDADFWRERTATRREARIKRSAQATAIRAYRHHVIERKLCPKAARQAEIELGKQLILQMAGGLFGLIPVPGVPGSTTVKSVGELISAAAGLLGD